MLRLALSPGVEQFRSDFRGWLDLNPPPQKDSSDSSLDTFVRIGREWQARLSSGSWIGVHWPSEAGGRSLTLVEEAVVQEELARVSSPQILGLFGLTMVGPVLISHGTSEQRLRFLPQILNGSEIWCQGFSEPGAGSDLAAIRTKARITDDGFFVSGQKVWTSFAHIADWCFVLCRTEEGSERHHGLSYLLVPMNSPGITVRPLKQISGDDEFNEVFFDEVFVPKENIVGQPGEGWKIAISTLMYERVVLTFSRQLQSENALKQLVAQYRDDPDVSVRSRLFDQVVNACAIRALAYEHLVSYANGKVPGPEGSMDKLSWSESFQELNHLALDLLGPLAALSEQSPEAGEVMHRYLYSRGRTIAAGTSEIQRSIIAERLLNLPRLK